MPPCGAIRKKEEGKGNKIPFTATEAYCVVELLVVVVVLAVITGLVTQPLTVTETAV